MLTTFDEIIEVTLHHEGGYVHDPKDLGGETNFGIAKRFYPDVDIKNLTKEGAKEIYKKDYWDKNKIDDLPEDLKLLLSNEINETTKLYGLKNPNSFIKSIIFSSYNEPFKL